MAKRKETEIDTEKYVSGILSGNIAQLSRAITLVESSLKEHRETAQIIVDSCLPHTGKSVRIGITGAPGVGKSSFIETLGILLAEKKNRKIAVLAIDPSSEISGGSILADKVRMEKLSSHKNAYIRPSPSSGSLGGVAEKTRETVLLCEAAGFEVIIIETVGVGQSEIKVHSMVDFFLLLQLAGAGDEIQGIKRGIMEMADLIAITKADGKNKSSSLTARKEYENALSLFPPKESGWKPRVLTCSSQESKGISEIWEVVEEYMKMTKESSYFENNRKRQAKYWLHESVSNSLKSGFYNNEEIKNKIHDIEENVMNKDISPQAGAEKLLDLYFASYRHMPK